ncbi:OsmC family protein [Streptomyces somaliensis DSM 40738]|uniref:OsmC family protein n=1 Tax=Streptomyces somaliensis TaxID=78355 RepID=UPI0021C41CD8|nr:OsmC family protein [Streptomyces somaliensis]MCQ0025503.1 OsmC family protein [Streptomyces somaliensis DSM 40738]
MDYTVTVRHSGTMDLTASNGRSEVDLAWGPEPGRWMATELFLAGLGACMLATMADYAQSNGLPVEGASVRVGADSAARPARMSAIHVTYTLPASLNEQQVQALIRAGNRCKVHNTLENHPEFRVGTAPPAVTA